jgi:hypothetical protein
MQHGVFAILCGAVLFSMHGSRCRCAGLYFFIDPGAGRPCFFFLCAALTSMHGHVIAARGLVIFFILIDPCAGRQSLSLPLAKESNQRKRLGR